MLLVAVLVLVGWIGLKAGLALVATHAQAEQQLRLVSNLAARHRRLEDQAKALRQPATIVRDARVLGMVKAGERPYVVVGGSHR